MARVLASEKCNKCFRSYHVAEKWNENSKQLCISCTGKEIFSEGLEQLLCTREDTLIKAMAANCCECNIRLTTRVKSCDNGHLMCSTCRKDLMYCPICYIPFSFERILPDIAKQRLPPSFLDINAMHILYGCKYRSFGCPIVDTADNIKNHYRTCQFLSVPCALCGHKMNKSIIYEHWIKDHPEEVVFNCRITDNVRNFKRFIRAYDQTLMLNVYRSKFGYNVLVIHLTTHLNLKVKFNYLIKLISDNPKANKILRGQCLVAEINEPSQIIAVHKFHISGFTLEEYNKIVNKKDGTFKYQVTILK